jgi:hypothetical protein
MKEGTLSEFLVIKFTEYKEVGMITLTKKELIKKIIAATNLEDCNSNWTAAATAALGMNPDGELMTKEWSYPSIVGILLYLLTNTRPDIPFIVSQVTHFSYSPKQSHASAVKQIVCYLSHTWDKRMIVKPTNTLQLVDVDFAGLYNCDPDLSPSLPNLTSATLFLLAEYLLCGTCSFIQKFTSVLLTVNIQACHRLCMPFCQSAHC